ncbi:hypothetical protein CBR_g55402 [Chara braunii]|uniref:DUF4042 domain-containing protein n=1 Tax=Chara braunii TaxID=69332 RepID=A0A388K7R0_CHABU|nr:hypothetical protein CBR_g55402 [Chara braunii]|eukprot:GBG66059.1 hypothetical protein CBR_g55402 [Chara braunii]
MDSNIFHCYILLAVIPWFHWILRKFDDGYFLERPCTKLAACHGEAFGGLVRPIPILNGQIVYIFTHITFHAVIRVIAAVAQLYLMSSLRSIVPELKKDPAYELRTDNRRLVTVVDLSFYLTVPQCAISLLIVFLPFIKGICWNVLRGNIQEPSRPFSEQLVRAVKQAQIDMTWMRHCCHSTCEMWYQNARESLSRGNICGLEGYWFYDVKTLLDIVGNTLFVVDNSYSGSVEYGHAEALSSLRELSINKNAWGRTSIFCCRLDKFMLDLPQTNRCKHDVDAGRDFAYNNGYGKMLGLLRNCPPTNRSVQYAASILAGFASGLSVLPWQPVGSGRNDGNQTLNMLRDSDFANHIVSPLLEKLITLLTRAYHPLQAAEAISSFAHAASEIHAYALSLVATQEEMQRFIFSERFSNAFTTHHPTGWLLRTELPDFQRANRSWVPGVRSVLERHENIDILLRYADWRSEETQHILSRYTDGNDDDTVYYLPFTCIQTLSSLWSRRILYWHRFEKPYPASFPEPLATIRDDDNDVRERLKDCISHLPEDDHLVRHACFSMLHLAKICISQSIRDIDVEIGRGLIRCLKYAEQDQARQLKWFACETAETLRDLLLSSVDKHDLRRVIATAAGESLLSMLTDNRCSASAAALLADVLTVPDFRNEYGILPTNEEDEGRFYNSLEGILEPGALRPATCIDSQSDFESCYGRITSSMLEMTKWFVLHLCQSFGNVAWWPTVQPPSQNDASDASAEWHLEYFERRVNAVLAVKHGTRLVNAVLPVHAPHVERRRNLTAILNRVLEMVGDHFNQAPSMLSTQLGLVGEEREWYAEIQNQTTDALRRLTQ